MKCKNCGTEFAEGTFCPECGTKCEDIVNGEDESKNFAGEGERLVRERQKQKKKIWPFALVGTLLVFLAVFFALDNSGGNSGGSKAGVGKISEKLQEVTSAPKENDAVKENDPVKKDENMREASVSYALMAGSYVFSSGAGGWGTDLKIAEDGTFTGQYIDSDMGDAGVRYPNGTVYICNFKGKFTDMQQVDDYSYSMRLDYLEAEGREGEQYFEDNMRYIYSAPYGFEEADRFMLYLPGMRMSSLPVGFVDWCRAFFNVDQADKLPYRGIYNIMGEYGFVEWSETKY